MKSVMQHSFASIENNRVQRSVFNRSHGHKTTFDTDYLIPIYWDEALPGDSFRLKMSALARLATPIFPIMDNVYIDTFFFAVPNRLIWDNWQRFCGERTDPNDSIDYTVPTISFSGNIAEQSIYDYMGLPIGLSPSGISALYFRAYNLIYNEWFRDQNLIDSVTVNRGDGPDTSTTYTLLKRCKRHDYFTSCLPWPQKGDSVDIPLGTSAPVTLSNASGAAWKVRDTAGTLQTGAELNLRNRNAGGTAGNLRGDTGTDRTLDPNGTLFADLSAATAATVNQLREAFQVQRLLERDARGGSRYVEILRSHFGVHSPDARLQRPEYLGGGSTPISISPIAQTSSTDATTPQGNLSAMGVAGMSGHGFSKSFVEHCVIIGLANIRADLTYQQGIDRHFTRSTRYDYYWPAFAHLGEQAVLNKEIYAQDTAADNNVFGYQERYAEYRFKQSKISGRFRSTAAASLDAWHLSQEFTALPTLGQTFISEAVPMDRVIAVNTEPHIIFDSFFDLKCVRPMPVYGIPGYIDRF